ncbi:hypothetical protein CLV30_12552 [Haloactinopolyspora alba]|uniref:Uncharacterized protein n=1 Tax=Haloactinopolyspora alba TaxID=648780 RepID=A0A2P8DHH2_9ACTN|nr:hypothetical protein [Haloactinopolyspora alba]PSK96670.1 hypothetical protein CLV30_12552 [Haloactinopolyspora alba]
MNRYYDHGAGRRMDLEHADEPVWPVLVLVVGLPLAFVLLIGAQIGIAVSR